MKANGIAIQLI